MIEVRVNGNRVAEFNKRIDLTEDGKLLDNAGKKLYQLIFRP
jgi:hypothetical protein